MYEVVFTNLHTHTDLVGKATHETLVNVIIDMVSSGLVLSEIRRIDEKAS